MRDQLLASVCDLSMMPPLRGSGVYLFCLDQDRELPGVELGNDRVLYVGMTEKDLVVRNHFLHRHSGGSTLRRSLGALLLEELKLQPIRRDCKLANADKYRFTRDGEERLTAWMTENLVAAQIEVKVDVQIVERTLIIELEPPLNLTGWKNPQKELICGKRAACRDDVRASFSARTEPD